MKGIEGCREKTHGGSFHGARCKKVTDQERIDLFDLDEDGEASLNVCPYNSSHQTQY